MVDRKFDIFQIIKEIEGRQIEFFDNLQEYEIKQIAPLVLMKWMSGVKDSKQLININDTINRVIFGMYRHPKLMYKLLMTCSTRKDKRVSWMKRPKNEKHALSLKVISEYYDCSISEAKDYFKLLTNDEILDLGDLIGLDKETNKKLVKELNGK